MFLRLNKNTLYIILRFQFSYNPRYLISAYECILNYAEMQNYLQARSERSLLNILLHLIVIGLRTNNVFGTF